MRKNNNDPTKIMAYRDFVPDGLRFWLTIVIALVYLFSGAIQLASAGSQVGALSLLFEDTQMIAYSAFVGMNMIFPILFSIRFRYSTKTMLTAVTCVLILCHLASLSTTSVPLLCLINFVAGTFRMIGAFEAMVIIQLVITPTRNYAMFYSTIFFIVQGSALFFGAQINYILEYLSYHHLHILALLLLLWTQLAVFVLFRHYRSMRRIPLYGIDWTGYLLWCVSLLSILFIAIYGKYMEWFASRPIRLATVVLCTSLVFNLWHMHHIKRPYISLETWKYKNLWKLVLMFLLLYITLATAGTLQNPYMASILRYDPIHLARFNWFALGGMAASALLCYVWFVRYRKRIKPMIFIGYISVVFYLVWIYASIDPFTYVERFYFPAFLRGFGLLMLYIVLTLYVANITPFKHNFQALCIIGFIRMSIGSAVGGSVIDNAMHYLTKKNALLLSVELDHNNPITTSMPLNELVAELQRQVMMVSMKEVYGWFIVVGCLILTGIIFERNISGMNRYFPKMKTIRHLFKRETV